MSASVTIVIPALDTPELFESHLPPLLEELERRGAGDHVIVVDDTGTGALARWLAERFPAGRHAALRVVARESNGGFAQALKSGVEAAEHPLVFSMNSDVRVRPGFLEPLVACMQNPTVLAASPRVLLDGNEDAEESRTDLILVAGLPRLTRTPAVRGEEGVVPVPFAVGGTCLFRRAEFLERGGFDPLFEPFYLEDLDWCWEGWARGRQVVHVPTSVVEHHHRGTIGARVPADVVRAAIERNQLLFLWKHLDDPGLLGEHLIAMARRASSAWITEDREALVWLALALDEREAALAARRARGTPVRDYRAIVAAAHPDAPLEGTPDAG